MRWNDISADQTIGTMPKTTINRTAGNANAQPTTCSDRRIRRAFTSSRSSSSAQEGTARNPFACSAAWFSASCELS